MFDFFDRYGWVIIALAVMYFVGHVIAYFIRLWF